MNATPEAANNGLGCDKVLNRYFMRLVRETSPLLRLRSAQVGAGRDSTSALADPLTRASVRR